MTQEQCKRAVELDTHIKELNKIKSNILANPYVRLGFIQQINDKEWRALGGEYLHYLNDVLRRCYKMVKQEIDQEIDNLLKELNDL